MSWPVISHPTLSKKFSKITIHTIDKMYLAIFNIIEITLHSIANNIYTK